jgi:hypothetical protein
VFQDFDGQNGVNKGQIGGKSCVEKSFAHRQAEHFPGMGGGLARWFDAKDAKTFPAAGIQEKSCPAANIEHSFFSLAQMLPQQLRPLAIDEIKPGPVLCLVGQAEGFFLCIIRISI